MADKAANDKGNEQRSETSEEAAMYSTLSKPKIIMVESADRQTNEHATTPKKREEPNVYNNNLLSPQNKELHATGSSNLGVSMISAGSDAENTPARSKPKKHDLTLTNQKSSLNQRVSDDDENDEDAPQKELSLPSHIYKQVVDEFPANPLLPKNFKAKDDSPRSGGLFKFMKLTKFRGMDCGKSKFRQEALKIEKIVLPEGCTIRKIFKVINQPKEPETPVLGADGQPIPVKKAPLETAFGELVYQRTGNNKNIGAEKKQFVLPGTEPKDEVLEENLLDVRNLLKNATSSQAAHGKQAGTKALVNLAGIEPFYEKKFRNDRTLIFESRFESGNLAAALKVNDHDYHLALQNDVNTSGNTQWFFFRVSNTRSYSTIRFNILNLCKPDSLYNEGMKVLVYSEKHAAEKDIGWHRGGSKISYYQNGIKKDTSKSRGSLYTLTFTYDFEYDDDNVFFAYCYPYTYSELVDELNEIMTDPVKQQYVTRKPLADTLAGNKLEMLTITSKQNPENMHKRKGVILTARVHPGESVGSWMMKGALDFLVDPNSIEAEYLRQNFVFKVLPMLNPDGVINGNYRCSLAGCDLNRRWKRPSKVLHPEIYATKQLCHQFSKERDLQIFCDFHGHSRRKNIFMYGCNVPNAPEDTRLFPFIMSQICPFFVYNYSRFGNQKSKESTARMALFNELKCPAIYTIESSFCGNDEGPYKGYHFSTTNLMQTGRDFCRTLMLYLPIQVPKNIISNFMTNINDLYMHYKVISDSNGGNNVDVENMEIYFERIKKVQANQKEIQSKHIRKGILAVLRQTAEIFTDGNQSSTDGSCQAPSDDNLDVEEIEKVLPIQEDPDLMVLKKSRTLQSDQKKDEQPSREANVASPLKRRNTVNDYKNKIKGALGKNISGQMKKNKRNTLINLQGAKIDEIEENDADDEKDTIKKEEEKDQVLELKDQDNGNVIHKKRRRKNVESKDAQTQTDRSDYQKIKQRMIEIKKQQMQRQYTELLAANEINECDDQDTQLLQAQREAQKNGLVQELVNHYQGTPTHKNNNIQLSNNFTQLLNLNSANKRSEKVQNENDTSPLFRMTTGQEYINSAGSPGKKHRNLIQSRVGAAAVASNLFVNNNERKAPSIQGNYNGARSQTSKPRLNTHNGPRPNKGAYMVEQADEKAMMSHGSMNNQQPMTKEQTHWQKVSRSNHELTKLFYQLPGGQKSLVQNAIQSQNNNFQNQLSNHVIKNKKTTPYADKKSYNATPEMLEFLRERQDLPELQNHFALSGLASSNKTPMNIKIKQNEAGYISQFQTNNTNSNKTNTAGFFDKSPHSLQNSNLSGAMNPSVNDHSGIISQTSKKPPSKARNLGTGSFSNVVQQQQQRPQTRDVSMYPSPLFKPQMQYNKQNISSGIEITGQRKIQDNYDAQLYRYDGVNGSQSNLRYMEMRESSNQMKTFQGNYIQPKKGNVLPNRASQEQFYQGGGQTSFSNIYVGQALAGQQPHQMPGPAQSRYKGGSVTTSKIQVNSNLAHLKTDNNGSRASRGSLVEAQQQQQNNNNFENAKVDIMENKFIQEKLQNLQMNGDLRDVSELNDQITAQINNAIRQGNHPIYNAGPQTVQQKLSFNINGKNSNQQVNVFNNFRSHNNEQQPLKQGGKPRLVPSRGPGGDIEGAKESLHPQEASIINSRLSNQEHLQQQFVQNQAQLTQISRNGQGNRVQTANNIGGSHKGQARMHNQITDQYLQGQPPAAAKQSIQSKSSIKQHSSKNVMQQGKQDSDNFIHVQRIVPSGSFTGEQQKRPAQTGQRRSSGQSIQGPVTQIVNVHNQFNISNNIIIDPNSLPSQKQQPKQQQSHTISGAPRFGGKPPTKQANRRAKK